MNIMLWEHLGRVIGGIKRRDAAVLAVKCEFYLGFKAAFTRISVLTMYEMDK